MRLGTSANALLGLILAAGLYAQTPPAASAPAFGVEKTLQVLTFSSFFPQVAANTLFMGPGSGAADYAGFRNLSTVNDFIVNGLRFITCRQNSTVDIQNTVTETVLYTCQIPAGALGTTGAVEVKLFGDWLHNNVAGDSVTFRLKFGCTDGTAGCPGGLNLYRESGINGASLAINANRYPWVVSYTVQARNAINSQAGWGYLALGECTGTGCTEAALTAGYGYTGNAAAANKRFMSPFATDLSTFDTSANSFFLTVTIQHGAASANNSWRLIGGYTEIMP